MARKKSYLTACDHFCGLGGNSQGIIEAGGEIRQAINHDERAIEAYAANHRGVDVIQTDLINADPRNFERTDIFAGSPECQPSSPGPGLPGPHRARQWRLWDEDTGRPDAREERSRLTMRDVVRFAEHHQYEICIIENVVEVRGWPFYPRWLAEMEKLGYRYKELFLNAQHFDTPQSRDRLYVVFWKRANRAPDLEHRPVGFCADCASDVEAIQSWKRSDRRGGKYRQQYVFRCPRCAGLVEPYYHAAANVIDWTLPIARVGDRRRRIVDATRARIKAGIVRYQGDRAFLFPTSHGKGDVRFRSLEDVLPAVTTRRTEALAVPAPFMVAHFGERPTQDPRTHSLREPLPTVTTRGAAELVVPPPFIITNNRGAQGSAITDPIGTITTRDGHALCMPPSFLASYYRTLNIHQLTEPVPTIPTVDRHALVTADDALDVDACGYRMLEPHELLDGQGFPRGYIVPGRSKHDKTWLIGNANPPRTMRWLFGRAAESLR